MPGRTTHDSPQLDATTSREVARGIGERLKQSLGNDTAFPDRLQQLLDQMRDLEMRGGGPGEAS